MDTQEPLVSIGIPAYKGTYLKDTINSVINQTYQNTEIVIINDCSPNSIKEIVSDFHDNRIKYFENKKNIGKNNPANNWNECVLKAKGDFFALLCDDDMYEETFIEKMVALTHKYPQTDVFRSRGVFIDKYGTIINKYPSSPEMESTVDYMWHVFNFYRYQTISEFMFRRKKIIDSGGFASLPIAWYADYLSIYKFSLKGGIASCSDSLTFFRQSGDNLSSQDDKNTIQKLIASKNYILKVCDILGDTHLPKDEQKKLTDLLHYHVKRNTKYCLKHAPYKILWKLLFSYKLYNIPQSWIWNALWHHT